MTKFDLMYKKIINEDLDELREPQTTEDFVFHINDILGSGAPRHFDEISDFIQDLVKNLTPQQKLAIYKGYRAEMKEVGDKPLPGETRGMAEIFGIKLKPRR
jgi:hypothetical protein